MQHVVDAAELTKECVDRLVEENGAEKALAEVGKCRVVKLRNLAREYDGLQIAGRENLQGKQDDPSGRTEELL